MRFEPLDSLCLSVTDCPHSTPLWTDSGHVVIRNQNIKKGRLDLTSPSFTNAEVFAERTRRAKPQPGDLIITREAPMGEVCMVPEGVECCLGQRQVLLRPDPSKVDGRYLLYAIQSPIVQRQIQWSEGTGSTVSNLRIPHLKAIKIPYRPLSEQTSIGETLGTLDERIELLKRTSATLESIAQAIFKSWFIDFDPVRAKANGLEPEGMDAETASLFPAHLNESALGQLPSGWRVGSLGEIGINLRDQARPDQLDPDVRYIGLEHMPRKSLAINELGIAAGLASGKFWFNTRDILFGKLRPYFHKVCIAPFAGVCSTDILVVRPTEPMYHGFLTMHLFSEAVIQYASRLSSGARMPRTSWNDIASYLVPMPPDTLLIAFDKIVQPLFDRILLNTETVRCLSDLRDTLLPRLVSGKLRAPEAQEAVEEALA